MIRHRQGKTDAASGSLLPVSSPEAALHGSGDASKAGSLSKGSVLGTRRRKIRSKRKSSSGWSCCCLLCVLPLLLIISVVLYAKNKPLHQHQHEAAHSKIMALYSRMEPYLSTSSATTLGHLLEHDPHLEQIFQAAKPVEITINNKRESVFVAFLTIRDASPSPASTTTTTTTSSSSSSSSKSSKALHSPYKVFQGHSAVSARDALHQALSHTGVLPILARSKWIYLEFVDSVTSLEYWNYQEPIPREPESWWYGLSIPNLGENNTFTFTPAEVFTHALVDSRGYLRWDHLWNLVETKGRLGGRRKYTPLEHLGVTTDDAAVLPQVDVFTSQAYFGEVVTEPSSHQLQVGWVPLVHGHRMFPGDATLLSHVHFGITDAIQYWLANIVQDDGSMIYAYHPRSNLVKQPHDDVPLDYHYMTRHMGTLYAMSQWLLHQPTQHQAPEHQALVVLVHDAVVKGLDYILSKALHRDCPVPLNPDVKARCMVEMPDGGHTTTRIDLNALTILALTEYVKVLTSASVHDQDEQLIEQYWKAAVDLSMWIAGAQRADGTLVQKVILKPSLELDHEYYMHYYPGLVAFAMARLYSVAEQLRNGGEPLAHKKSLNDKTVVMHRQVLAMLPKVEDQQTWFNVAAKTAQLVVAEEQDKNHEDADFVLDHWLLNGLAELHLTMKEQKKDIPGSLVEYIHHAIQVLRKYQTTEAALEEEGHHQNHKPKENIDRTGIFYDDISASATALKVNGLCSVYDSMDAEHQKLILEMVETSVRYQLQSQFGPELAMFMAHPHLVLGGFRESIMSTELRVDYIQYNMESLMCLQRILRDQTK